MLNHLQPQDPGYYGPEVAIRTRDVMRIRYTLLPYLYTLFHNAHAHGSSVVRPMYFEFSSDNNTYDLERQFMWGSAFLIIPILEEVSYCHEQKTQYSQETFYRCNLCRL